MSAIENTNDKVVMIVPQSNIQRAQNVEQRIARIDREIEVRSNYMAALKDSRDSHIEHRQLLKEQIQLLQESKELDRKRIFLLQDTNNKLQALLDRKSSKIDVSEIKLLDKQLDTLTKKESVLKGRAVAVDSKIEKVAIKVDFQEKQLAKIETKSETAEVHTSQAKQEATVFVKGYEPNTTQLMQLELSKIKQNAQGIKDLDIVLQQRVINSQKNIYESIMSKTIADKLTKLL